MANFDDLVGLALVELVEEAEIIAQYPDRQFYPRINAFNLSDEKFVKLIRLTKDATRELVNSIIPFVAQPTRGSALDVTTKVSIYQICI